MSPEGVAADDAESNSIEEAFATVSRRAVEVLAARRGSPE